MLLKSFILPCKFVLACNSHSSIQHYRTCDAFDKGDNATANAASLAPFPHYGLYQELIFVQNKKFSIGVKRAVSFSKHGVVSNFCRCCRKYDSKVIYQILEIFKKCNGL